MIDNKFLPAITNHFAISSYERKLFSLPVKMGGLGVPIFYEPSVTEYKNSRIITNPLANNIVANVKEYIVDEEEEKSKRRAQKKEKDEINSGILAELRKSVIPNLGPQ